MEQEITKLQLIESCFLSLSSIYQPDLHKIHIKFSHPEPSFLVLCTLFYKIVECVRDSLTENYTCLRSTLSQFKGVHVNYCESKIEIIFLNNTTTRGKPEMKIAERICTIVGQSYIEAEIPARSYLNLN